MFNLFTYHTPKKYAEAYKETCSYVNIKQIKTLCILLLMVSGIARVIGTIFANEIFLLPSYGEYNLSNIIQLAGSTFFLTLAIFAGKPGNWKGNYRNLLTLFFAIYTLYVTFNVTYIYSQHNAKNNLAVFLIGLMAVSIFFSLRLKHIIIVSCFVIVLFQLGMVLPSLNPSDKILNTVASLVLAFFLYTCSRYSYYFKSQHFVQLKELEEKNKEVQLLNHQKGEILGFVAHDLRNPLNNIEALSRILLEEKEFNKTPELQLILTSSRQAKDIINDLIEVVQEEKAPLILQDIEMIGYLKNVCNHWQANIDKLRSINVITTETELPALINPSKFTRVIDNLIGNGLKFSNSKSPIDVEISRMDDLCKIRITDYGIGIPLQLQEMLFDQFSKAGRPGLMGEKSIGLGLHISRQILEQHGAVLRVESEENVGTSFIITIALASQQTINTHLLQA